MAEDTEVKSGRSRFKSKWAKVFKENDGSAGHAKSTPSHLNSDLDDFLKPSKEASAEKLASIRPHLTPKLDIAIAKRFPDAHDVRLAGMESPAQPPFFRKPRRRPGLAVSFVKTPPDVIGEGGEESELPSIEISKRKHERHRLVGKGSAPSPHSSGLQIDSQSMRQSELQGPGREITETQHHSDHTHIAKGPSPPPPQIFRLKRTPTGFNTQDYSQSSTEDLHDPIPDQKALSINTQMRDRISPQQASNLLSPSSREPMSPALLKQKSMRANEGMALRRASAMIVDADDSSPTRSNEAGFEPSSKYYNALSKATPPSTSHGSTSMVTGSSSFGPSPSNHHPAPMNPKDRSHESRQDARGQVESGRNDWSQTSSHDFNSEPLRNSPHTSPYSPERSFTREHKSSPNYFSGPRLQPNPSTRSMESPKAGIASVVPDQKPVASVERRSPALHGPPIEPGAQAALIDFSGRVSHMKGVFRLTAEKEKPSENCSPAAWARTAIWWYLKGKAGLETLVHQRSPAKDSGRELLLQPHVDIAKALWIVNDPLRSYADLETTEPISSSTSSRQIAGIRDSISAMQHVLRTSCLLMTRHHLLPPHQSLIQGQDTRIWLETPNMARDIAALLGSSVRLRNPPNNEDISSTPLNALPLGDTRSTLCYGRFPVEVSMNTEDVTTDRVPITCTLTMLRGSQEYPMSLVIASQSELVTLHIGSRKKSDRGLTWSIVSWKANSSMLFVHLAHGVDVFVRMHEQDFQTLWNLVEYAHKVERNMLPEKDEKLIFESRPLQIQYADSTNPAAFPADKVNGGLVLVFQQSHELSRGGGVHKLHHGHRILLVTDTTQKSLASVGHTVGQREPLHFEFMTDAAAHGTTALVIRIMKEDQHQRSMLMVFPDAASRQALYDVLNGLNVNPNETIVGRTAMIALNIQPASSMEALSPSSHPALQALQWQKLGVTNLVSDDPNERVPNTLDSNSLRLVARHSSGCITDRMNLGQGELLLRLPCALVPTIQILREPQIDLTMSIDTRSSPGTVVDGLSELLHIVRTQPTIRTLTFATHEDLHDFQQSITGQSVIFDAMASSFGISRRMMMVPIYHKWQATHVRVQVVIRNGVYQVLVFMEDFDHADAMCFQVKSTDVFEKIKGDHKSKKWAVKMVDAKFSLPKEEKGEVEMNERIRRRFVNLDGLEYAEEHDDITVGFDTEEDRDRFATALPAATTVSRMITLKRRI